MYRAAKCLKSISSLFSSFSSTTKLDICGDISKILNSGRYIEYIKDICEVDQSQVQDLVEKMGTPDIYKLLLNDEANAKEFFEKISDSDDRKSEINRNIPFLVSRINDYFIGNQQSVSMHKYLYPSSFYQQKTYSLITFTETNDHFKELSDYLRDIYDPNKRIIVRSSSNFMNYVLCEGFESSELLNIYNLEIYGLGNSFFSIENNKYKSGIYFVPLKYYNALDRHADHVIFDFSNPNISSQTIDDVVSSSLSPANSIIIQKGKTDSLMKFFKQNDLKYSELFFDGSGKKPRHINVTSLNQLSSDIESQDIIISDDSIRLGIQIEFPKKTYFLSDYLHPSFNENQLVSFMDNQDSILIAPPQFLPLLRSTKFLHYNDSKPLNSSSYQFNKFLNSSGFRIPDDEMINNFFKKLQESLNTNSMINTPKDVVDIDKIDSLIAINYFHNFFSLYYCDPIIMNDKIKAIGTNFLDYESKKSNVDFLTDISSHLG